MPRSAPTLLIHTRHGVALLALLVAGCSNHPAYVCMRGDITAKGAMKTSTVIDNNVTPVAARALPRSPKCSPKIAVIDVDGVLVNRNLVGLQSMGENPVALFREKLDAAAADPCVAAVVLRINSPGGGVTATDMMRHDLVAFKLRTGLPVIACLMDVGAGGAYCLATAADTVYAHPTTVTGGLGVILNLYDMEDALSQQNIFERAIKSGAMVDIGSPTRAMVEEEKTVLEDIAKQYHRRLRATVMEARSQLVQRLPEEVPVPGDRNGATGASAPTGKLPNEFAGTVFDGRVFTSEQALHFGLIDNVGYLDDALAAARGLGGVTTAKTVLYRRNTDRALTPYDITQNTPGGGLLPLSIPGYDRAQLPMFLYIWQPEPLYEKNGGP
ncbi:Putative signal peptide peptidase SppA [Pirellulimonas nuda]|uniref:Signal peptide peptidase SppA n=1 Tax=Pirellulimonas nuda TaxID=2528009 RepID=A0A518DHA2_9BACT|nr:S49 family peptidase [Pirellulimonas nuda]QDU90855.1 Putative signal peptide peptidase SppA [Pirellulimonas nuda]